MSKFTIPHDEHGKVRLFRLSLPDNAAEALKDNSNGQSYAQTLGTDAVDADHVEVFHTDDLGALGLAGYLRAGIDANEDEIARDAARLDAAQGWVMLVHSAAFEGQETTLDPIAEIQLVGTYMLAQADHSKVPLESDAAAPYTGVPNPTPATPPGGRAGGSLVAAGIVVLIMLLLWWVLF